MHVAFVRLQQLLAYSQHPFLTRSEMDRAAKPLMRVCGEQFVHKLSNLNNLPIPASTHMSYKTYKSYKTYSFSVSALQEYLECPYSFYAKYVLKAAPPQTPTLEPDGKIRGSFVHDILRRLFQAYGSQLFLPEAISPICNKLPALVERAAEKDEELKNFPAAVVQEFTHRVTRTITALIEREATDYANKKKQTLAKFSEWDFGRSLQRPFEITTPDGLIQITGRIDRIDINEDKKQFTVIDFKTGELPTKEEILGGRALQLPLYLMAVQKTLLPTHTPSAALYYGLKKDRVFGFALKDSCDEKTQRKTNHISQEEWQEVQNQVLVHCVHAVHQVHQGNFDPKPHDIKKCEHCDFKRICGYKATCPEREKRVEG
jgi:ATP-dependent helicase/DNAse subunit B